MKVSVVIVNYNVSCFLELCLNSVFKSFKNIEGEVIVVDNASNDESCDMITTKFPAVKLIANQHNVGFSKANNQGVAIAKGEYVLILNPDTVVGENLFEKIIPFADKQQKLGALGVRLIDGTGNFLPESKRGIPTPKTSFYKLIGSSKGRYYANYLTEEAIGKIDVLVGAFMLLKKETYLKVNGFDEDYFMYGEDIDLSYKLLKAGYTNFYFGKTSVIHYKGESTRKDIKYLRYFYGAMNIFYKKHLKLSFLDYFLMRVGVKIWFFFKCFQMMNTPIITENTKNILFIGNSELVKQAKIQKNIIAVTPDNLYEISQLIELHTIEEIWLDENYLSFKEIINEICTHRYHKVLYKILPSNSKFLIGSNSADGRGEIIDLS